MVIGSDKQGNNGYELTVRKMYNSRISSYGFIFDKDSNLTDIRDYGYSLDGKFPDMKGHASSTSVRPNKRETITQIAKITSPAFAKKIYQHVKKNNKMDESVNEGISVFDERHFGKKGIIIMIDDNGKKVSAIFKDKKNADKFNRNKPSDIKKLLQLAKKTKYPKAIDESLNEAGKLAMGIAALTGTRGSAVQDFIDKNRINDKKLFKALKKANLQGRINFASALAGRPGNPNEKLTIKLFGESKKEVIAFRKKAKSETAFYDILDKVERKYGRGVFEKWLDKSLKDLKLNPKKYKTSADKQEALFQAKL